MLQAMYPDEDPAELDRCFLRGTFTNRDRAYWAALTNAPLYRLEEMNRNQSGSSVAASRDAELLSVQEEVFAQLSKLAGVCSEEDPPLKRPRAAPVELLTSYSVLMHALEWKLASKLEAGDQQAALQVMEEISTIYAYLSRSDCGIVWLVGYLGPKSLLKAIAGVYARQDLDRQSAEKMGACLTYWHANAGTFVPVMKREQANRRRFVEAIFDRKNGFSTFESFSDHKIPTSLGSVRGDLYMRAVKYLGWITGNTRRSLLAVAQNRADRTMIAAVVCSDPSIEHPDEITRHLWDFEVPSFSRGRLGHEFTPNLNGYMARYYTSEAQLLIAHALTAVGVYQQEHGGRLPLTFEAAMAEMGSDYKLDGRYVKTKPEFKRLDSGGEGETNAYAYTLTVWGDGGRCPKEGGVSWLVCRNPAFGEAPFRCWQWMFAKKSDKHPVASPEVVWVDNHKDIPRSWHDVPHPVLQVPSDLLSEEPSAIQAAAKLAEKVGWQEDANPPQVTATSSSLAK